MFRGESNEWFKCMWTFMAASCAWVRWVCSQPGHVDSEQGNGCSSLQGGVSSCEISSDTDCTQRNGNLPCSEVGGGGKGSSQRTEEPEVLLLWVAVRSSHIIQDQNAHAWPCIRPLLNLFHCLQWFFVVLSKGFMILREKASAEVAEAAGGMHCLKGYNKWIPFLTALPLELLKASWHWN